MDGRSHPFAYLLLALMLLPCCALALGKTAEKYEERSVKDGRIETRTME